MSNFIGKCDISDTISIYGIDFILNNCQVFQNGKKLKLNKHSIIKYYPYLVSSMGMNKDSGGTINLTSESFVDSQNKERIKWYLEDLQKLKNGEQTFFDKNTELVTIKNIDDDNNISSEKKKELINSYLTSSALYYKVELCKEYLKDYYASNILQKDIYSLIKEINDCSEIYKKYGPYSRVRYFETFEDIKKELCRINFGTDKKL